MKAKLFHIWSEGYVATCEHGTAQYICSVYAKTFKEACISTFKKGLFDGYGNFNEEQLTLWGCHLYDNEQDARKSFG